MPLAASGDPDIEELAGEGTVLTELAIAEFSPRESVSVGDEVDLAIDLDRLRFFDLEDGTAIWS